MVGGHAVDSTEHTTYSSTIKYVYVRLIILIAVENRLGIMAVDIVNSSCTLPCAKTFWACCGADFDPRCGSVVVLSGIYMD